jgi:hypothetical protein
MAPSVTNAAASRQRHLDRLNQSGRYKSARAFFPKSSPRTPSGHAQTVCKARSFAGKWIHIDALAPGIVELERALP